MCTPSTCPQPVAPDTHILLHGTRFLYAFPQVPGSKVLAERRRIRFLPRPRPRQWLQAPPAHPRLLTKSLPRARPLEIGDLAVLHATFAGRVHGGRVVSCPRFSRSPRGVVCVLIQTNARLRRDVAHRNYLAGQHPPFSSKQCTFHHLVKSC